MTVGGGAYDAPCQRIIPEMRAVQGLAPTTLSIPICFHLRTVHRRKKWR
jgi:hypothetical protein